MEGGGRGEFDRGTRGLGTGGEAPGGVGARDGVRDAGMTGGRTGSSGARFGFASSGATTCQCSSSEECARECGLSREEW